MQEQIKELILIQKEFLAALHNHSSMNFNTYNSLFNQLDDLQLKIEVNQEQQYKKTWSYKIKQFFKRK